MEKYAIDSYVFLDLFLHSQQEETARKKFHKALQSKAVISSIALLEVKYQVMRKLSHEKAEEATFTMRNMDNVEIINVSPEIAETAADIRAKYYKKNERELSYADAIHIATAITAGCTVIITGDRDFERIEELKAEIY